MNALSTLSALLHGAPAFNAFPFSTSGSNSFDLISVSQDDPQLAFANGGGFNISGAAALCQSSPSHSWEYGAASLALLDLYTPWVSVYGMHSGWISSIPVDTVSIDRRTYLSGA